MLSFYFLPGFWKSWYEICSEYALSTTNGPTTQYGSAHITGEQAGRPGGRRL